MVPEKFLDLSWDNKLIELKKFVELNKRPPKNNEDEYYLLMFILDTNDAYCWFETDTKPLINKKYKEWELFLENYSKFIENINTTPQPQITSSLIDNKWNESYLDLKLFIEKQKRFPIKKEDETILYFWFRKQIYSYKQRLYVMKSKTIYNEWTNFTKKYKQYFVNDYGSEFDEIRDFMTEPEKWSSIFAELRIFVDIHKRFPFLTKNTILNCEINIDKEIELFDWIILQNKRYCGFLNARNGYKMMNCDEHKLWEHFTEYCQIHTGRKLLISPDEEWNLLFEGLKTFIDLNKKLPWEYNSCYEKRLFDWLLLNWDHESIKQFRKDQNIYFFTNWDYKNSTRSRYRYRWDCYFSEINHFISTNNRKPNTETEKEKILLKWVESENTSFQRSQSGYNQCINPFYNSNENIIQIFKEFLEKYNKLN